jgi:Xaa-Pro aminopeptidase
MAEVIEDESVRAARLLEAQVKAEELFAEVERRAIVTPGVSEVAASEAIRELAGEMFGIRRFWHKRIVRAGLNTLEPYKANPPNRLIAADDIVFLDFGPIFEEWEADFGRTFVLGEDPAKLRLRDALPVVWRAARHHFEATPQITGAQLYDHIRGLSAEHGYEYGQWHSGHLVGRFPHEKLAGNEVVDHIATGNDLPMRRPDQRGQQCHWILEVHLVDRARGFGGFTEELLDLGPGMPVPGGE